jgi:hypothetical protein
MDATGIEMVRFNGDHAHPEFAMSRIDRRLLAISATRYQHTLLPPRMLGDDGQTPQAAHEFVDGLPASTREAYPMKQSHQNADSVGGIRSCRQRCPARLCP